MHSRFRIIFQPFSKFSEYPRSIPVLGVPSVCPVESKSYSGLEQTLMHVTRINLGERGGGGMRRRMPQNNGHF